MGVTSTETLSFVAAIVVPPPSGFLSRVERLRESHTSGDKALRSTSTLPLNGRDVVVRLADFATVLHSTATAVRGAAAGLCRILPREGLRSGVRIRAEGSTSAETRDDRDSACRGAECASRRRGRLFLLFVPAHPSSANERTLCERVRTSEAGIPVMYASRVCARECQPRNRSRKVQRRRCL